MKLSRLLLGVFAAAGLAASSVALADHIRGRVGIYFGVPFPAYTYPYYYPYYSPPVVVAPPPPPVYIEQSAPPAQGGNYWYHCNDPEGYYPYVQSCPGGWQAIVPTPPPQ